MSGNGSLLSIIGLLIAEFHYSMIDALNEELPRALALVAVGCERNGMVGVKTYRSHEILAWLEENKCAEKSDKVFVFI